MSETQPGRMTYARYLGLDELLAAQHPLSDRHDEMLFVVIHQTKELWLKQIIHEVRFAQGQVRAGALVPAYKSLARVSRIQTVMTLSWDILATMTPADYTSFRGFLGTSSGFQSAQFREVERSEEHTSELQSRQYLVCRLLLEKKNTINANIIIKSYKRNI